MRTEKEIPTLALMTELDVLFDTRLGTILRHWPDTALKLLTNGYHDRICEKFPGIPYEEFNQRYAERDKVTLSKSVITRFVKFAKEFAQGVEHNSVTTPYKFKPKLIVNTTPYTLTENEEKGMIAALAKVTGERMDIEFVTMSYKDITPEWMNANVSMFCFYRYFDWLEEQYGDWDEEDPNRAMSIPEITMMVPRTSHVNLTKVSDDHFKKLDEFRDAIGLFVGMEYVAVELICPMIRLPDEQTLRETQKKQA